MELKAKPFGEEDAVERVGGVAVELEDVAQQVVPGVTAAGHNAFVVAPVPELLADAHRATRVARDNADKAYSQ